MTVTSNLVSGNGGSGILVTGNSLTVSDNLVGTNAAGTTALGNDGVGIDVGNPFLENGGMTVSGNVVAASGSHGVQVVRRTSVDGNAIGTDASGVQDLGNTGAGVHVLGDLERNRLDLRGRQHDRVQRRHGDRGG